MDPAAQAQWQQMQNAISSLQSQLDAAKETIQRLQGTTPNQSKIHVNKPEVFTGSKDDSLDSFIGHMDLYLLYVPPAQHVHIAVSYLSKHAYEWYRTSTASAPITDWESMKLRLRARFDPINKVKAARDKLAVWKQKGTVASYNESFLKIVIDIPTITPEESIDRYMRGLKSYISTEICTKDYTTLNQIMADALSVEAAKKTHFRSTGPYGNEGGQSPRTGNSQRGEQSQHVPMDVSNATVRDPARQRLWDIQNNACFYCHEPGCSISKYKKRKESNRGRFSANAVQVETDEFESGEE